VTPIYVPYVEPRKRALKPTSQTALPLDTARVERGHYAHYLVGGWPSYSQWIDPREIPICEHDHGAVSDELARKLVKKCLVTSHMRRACLTGPWREFEAGREVIVYGTKGASKWDLFVRETD